MNARVLLSPYPFARKIPSPSLPTSRKPFLSDVKHITAHAHPSLLWLRLPSHHAPHFRFSVRNSGERGAGKVWEDFKSEPYDVPESVPEPVKFGDVVGNVIGEKVELGSVRPWWGEFPKRWVIVLLCFTSFILCNMDRVNMSIAILPMSAEYNWNPATVGLIQSSFFWGYMLTQIAGGIWADTIGGKPVLGFGVVWWSIATVLTPVAAKLGLPFLLLVRAIMGIGEGVAMPAMNNIMSKWIPVAERSRSLSLVYSGMYLGSVIGLAFSPMLIQRFGWPSVFYSFGSLGAIWFSFWISKAHSSPLDDPELRTEEKKLIITNSYSKEPVKNIPWGLILSKAPVWALIVSHFCHNWGTFILLTWMPTYYNQIMQTIGFLGPAFFLTQLSRITSLAMVVLCMACSQATDAFSQFGLYSNHQDIAPRYSAWSTERHKIQDSLDNMSLKTKQTSSEKMSLYVDNRENVQGSLRPLAIYGHEGFS